MESSFRGKLSLFGFLLGLSLGYEVERLLAIALGDGTGSGVLEAGTERVAGVRARRH